MPGRRRAAPLLISGLAVAAFGAPIGMSRAQQAEPPNPVLTFSIGERLEISDNPDNVADPEEGGAYLRSDLGVAYLSETRSSSFFWDLDTSIDAGRFGDGQGSDSRLQTLGSSLVYSRESVSSTLEFGASYRRARLDDTLLFDVLLADEFENEDLVSSGGYRETTGASLDLSLGRETPIGVDLSLSYIDIGYEDTISADPRYRLNFATSVNLKVSPVLELGVVARADRDERDSLEEYESDSRTLALSAIYAASSTMAVSGEIGMTRTETSRTLNGSRRTNAVEGATGAISVDLARPNGTLGVAFRSSLDEEKRRNVIRASRALDLPLGKLAVSAGVSLQEEGDIAPVLAVDYTRETPRGGLTLAYDRSVSTDEDTDRVRSRLGLAYYRQINSVSSWRASVDYASVEVISGRSNRTSRLGTSLSFQRDLTQDWNLTAGYRYVQADGGEEDERQTNTVFFGISRDFTILP